MAKIIQDVAPRGMNSVYIEAPFDEAVKTLKENGYNIITAEDNAGLRIQEGKDSSISQNGNYIKEGSLYVLNKGRFLTKKSPVLSFPKKATDAHRSGEEFYISKEQVEKALTDSFNISDNIIEKGIPTNRLSEEGASVYLFGKNAENYGKFLKDAGIFVLNFYFDKKDYMNKQQKDYASQLWFDGLDDVSGLGGDDDNLEYGGGVRGVSESNEGITKYSEKCLKILKGVGEGTLPASELEEVIDFLENRL